MIDVDNEDFYTEQEAGFKRIYSDDADTGGTPDLHIGDPDDYQ